MTGLRPAAVVAAATTVPDPENEKQDPFQPQISNRGRLLLGPIKSAELK